jgi:hypothetical protein
MSIDTDKYLNFFYFILFMTHNFPFVNLQNHISFNNFFQPGIYIIFNKTNNKAYIGETENLADRLAGHFKKLKSNKSHDCGELQADWDIQNGENFLFAILLSGPEWSDKVLCLQKECEFLLSLGKENAYNFAQFIDYREKRQSIRQVTRLKSIAVIVYGVQYPSIREAAQMNNITSSAARKCLDDPNNENWSYVDLNLRRHSSLSKMIVVKGKLFVSLNAACSDLNYTQKTIRKYIHEKDDWHYFSDLSEAEQKVLLEAHPEISQLPSYPEGRPVRVGDIVYPTIVACAKEYGIHPRTVRKRIQSVNPSFCDWFWAEKKF